MGFFDEFSAKDVIMLVFAVGGAWSFVKFTLSALKGEIKEIKIQAEREKIKVEKLRESMAEIDLKLALITQTTQTTEKNIDKLTSYVESKI